MKTKEEILQSNGVYYKDQLSEQTHSAILKSMDEYLNQNKNKMNVTDIAKICHSANKAYCEAIGDPSQLEWDKAEQWQRNSAISGVTFRINNPGVGEDAQHNAWMKEKVDAGWIYGEKKDTAAKTHPCILPFEHLPKHEQAKDKLFCGIVDALKGLVY